MINMSIRIYFIVAAFLVHSSIEAQTQSDAFNKKLASLLSHSAKEITVAEAVGKKDVLFIDAREPNEFLISHLKDALFVGYDDFNLKAVESVAKDKQIIVYCSVGYRSEKISQKLTKAGFTNVRNMVGGIFEWVNEDNPVVDNQSNPTKNVHAYNKTWGVWLLKGNKIYE